MIIWQRWGILAAIIPILTFLILNTFFEGSSISFYSTFLISAIAVWVIGRALNTNPKYYLKDEHIEIGKIVKVKVYHTLFFIRMEYWAVIFLGFGLSYFLDNVSLPGGGIALIGGIGIAIIMQVAPHRIEKLDGIKLNPVEDEQDPVDEFV